jgi:multidrug efflux pump subunit AcrA (membrane-fusion protein)
MKVPFSMYRNLQSSLTWSIVGGAFQFCCLATILLPSPVRGTPTQVSIKTNGSSLKVTTTMPLRGDVRIYLSTQGVVTLSKISSDMSSTNGSSSNIFVTFTIPEDEVRSVAREFDTKRPIPVEAYTSNMQKIGDGVVVGIDNQIDADLGLLNCRAIVVSRLDTIILTNMVLNIRLLLETRHDVMLVPEQAVQRDPTGAFVYLVRSDHTITVRLITLGNFTEDSKMVEVKKGLSLGDVMVLDAPSDLYKISADR